MRPLPQQRIASKALRVWRIGAAVPMIFLSLLWGGYAYMTARFDLPSLFMWIAAVLIVLLAIVVIGIIPKLRWNRWRYEVYENEVDLMRGVLIVKRTLVPMVRVQHVDTEQGPLLRRYGLSTVTISTAATVHEIPALTEEEADRLRDRISALARVVDEDV